jgi:predicted double-glycine peptidase
MMERFIETQEKINSDMMSIIVMLINESNVLENQFTQLAQEFIVFLRSQCRFSEMLEKKSRTQN